MINLNSFPRPNPRKNKANCVALQLQQIWQCFLSPNTTDQGVDQCGLHSLFLVSCCFRPKEARDLACMAGCDKVNVNNVAQWVRRAGSVCGQSYL